jgi:RHS repeat-associated protein
MDQRHSLLQRLFGLVIIPFLISLFPPMPVESGFAHEAEPLVTVGRAPKVDMSVAGQTASQTHKIFLPIVAQELPNASATVVPGLGGSLTSPDSRIQVEFSPYSVQQLTYAYFQELSAQVDPPIGLAVGGPIFDLQARHAASLKPITSFPPATSMVPASHDLPATMIVTPSITVAVHYSDQDVWGLDLRTLALYTRKNRSDAWQALPTAVYQDRKLLVAEVDHFSEFVPMARLAVNSSSPSNKRLMIDPDNNDGFAVWPGVGTVREFTYNLRLATELEQRLESTCQVDVELSRTTASHISAETRLQAGVNFGPDIFTTLAFNTAPGIPWGVAADGGVRGWARNAHPNDDALVQEFFTQVKTYTTRPATQGVQHPTRIPAFSNLPSTMDYAHVEMLFLDHNYDWPVINTGFDKVVDAAYAALSLKLAEKGMLCNTPDGRPQLPAPPTPEQIQRWRDLGYQNYQTYGSDPVSFSTGNFISQVNLFRIPGRGGLDFNFNLTYNAQDGRNDLFGYSWSFPYNARLQKYNDESVSIVLHDGRTFHYTWNGSGYNAPAGVFDRLEASEGGWVWTTVDHEQRLVFQEVFGPEGSGFGLLREWRDRRGNTLHFDYDLSQQEAWRDGHTVPRPPLTAIRDDAGRTIAVGSDSEGRITELRLPAPDSRSFNFSYQNGDLVAITDAQTPVRGTRRFGYDDRHRMTKLWDAEEIFFLENQYDDRDRVIKQWDADRVEAYLSYDATSRITTFKDNLGSIWAYHYDSLNRVTREVDPLGGAQQFIYNPDYTLQGSIDERGNRISYSYDSRGNLLSRSDPLPQNQCSATVYTSDLSQWRYDQFNQVIGYTNALGAQWQYEYDGLGNLTKVIEPNGALTRFEYDAFGQVKRAIDALNRVTSYDYDLYGNQITITNPDGKSSSSTYDIVGRERSYSDANSHSVRFEYDGNDNITAIYDPKGQVSRFSYDRNNLLLNTVDRRQVTQSFRYDQNLKLIAERDFAGVPETLYEYDQLYRRSKMTDTLGYVSRYHYDPLGRLTSLVDPLGATLRYEYDAVGNLTAIVDPLGARTSMSYDSNNRISAINDAAGNQIVYCYDAEDRLVRTSGPRPGEVTSYHYDALGRPIKITNPLNASIEYGYDLVGNRSFFIDTIGYRTDYQYDQLNRLVAELRPALADGVRPTTRYEYDAVGNLVKVTTPRGFATKLAYDENDNLITLENALGAIARFSYDPEDNQISASDPNGNTTRTSYNPVGLPLSVQDGRGFTTRFEYDAAYNLVRLIDNAGEASLFEYDPLGRLIRSADPLGNQTRYKRDLLGRMVASTDANNNTTGYSYDVLGRLLSVTDAAKGASKYGYDAVGNLIEISDANGNSTRFSYDLLNQVRSERNPLGNTWRYVYDAGNRLNERIDALGRRTSYEYDSNHRMLGIDYGDPQEQAPVRFAYDLDGNQTQMCDGLGCTSTSYNGLGQRTSTTDWAGRTLRYSYDAAGNLIGMIYPNGGLLRYEYDQTNQMIGLSDPQGATSLFKRNALGQISEILKPNQTQSSYSYDAASRLTGIDNRKLGESKPQSAYAYTLDAVGNRTEVLETRAAFNGKDSLVTLAHSYEYDALNRLVRSKTAAPNSDSEYRFDAVGNRVAQLGTSLAPDPGTPTLPVAPKATQASASYNAANQLLSMGDSSFSYNNNGARTSKSSRLSNGKIETTTYLYDREDRLVGVTIKQGDKLTMEAEYRYDGYGRRAQKEVRYANKPVETSTYLYDGLDLVGAKLERDGISDESYYYLAPSPVTGLRRPFELERLPSDSTGGHSERYWYQFDGLDSVVGLTDKAGKLVSPFLYGDYGQLLAGNIDLQLLTYTAQDHDAETGLLHFYARYYDPSTGTWLSQDPYRGRITDPTTLHRYGYVGGNPTGSVDVLGYDRVNLSSQAQAFLNIILEGCGLNMSCITTYITDVIRSIWRTSPSNNEQQDAEESVWLSILGYAGKAIKNLSQIYKHSQIDLRKTPKILGISLPDLVKPYYKNSVVFAREAVKKAPQLFKTAGRISVIATPFMELPASIEMFKKLADGHPDRSTLETIQLGTAIPLDAVTFGFARSVIKAPTLILPNDKAKAVEEWTDKNINVASALDGTMWKESTAKVSEGWDWTKQTVSSAWNAVKFW